MARRRRSSDPAGGVRHPDHARRAAAPPRHPGLRRDARSFRVRCSTSRTSRFAASASRSTHNFSRSRTWQTSHSSAPGSSAPPSRRPPPSVAMRSARGTVRRTRSWRSRRSVSRRPQRPPKPFAGRHACISSSRRMRWSTRSSRRHVQVSPRTRSSSITARPCRPSPPNGPRGSGRRAFATCTVPSSWGRRRRAAPRASWWPQDRGQSSKRSGPIFPG